MNIEDIYYYYKNNINIYKLYYKDKYYKRTISFVLLVIAMVAFFILALFPAKYKNLKDTCFIIGILALIFTTLLIKKINKKILGQIKEEYKDLIRHNFKKKQESYFKIATNRKFIQYLSEIGITKQNQKEVLSSLLYEKYKQTKVSNIWVIGVLAALSLPIWSKIIDLELPNHIKSSKEFYYFLGVISIIIIVILMVITYIKNTIYYAIIDFMNFKSKRYYAMYEAIKMDIIYNSVKEDENINI